MSRLQSRIAKVEQDRFGKPGALTMTEHWLSSDEAPKPVVESVTVFGGGRNEVIRCHDHPDEESFWGAVDAAHLSINGRSAADGKSFTFHTHFEETP